MKIRELDPVLSKKAQDELNENPERIAKDLQAIKEWIAKEPHLSARTNDQWLLAFLRGCKFSLERTKEKIDMYYTIRSAIPEMCEPIDPLEPWVQEILSLGTAVPLPNVYRPGDPRIVLVRPGVYDPNKIPTMNTMRVQQLFNPIYLMEDDDSVVSGQRYIIDLQNVTFAHFTQMTPSLIKKMVVSGQDAMPLRQKGSHHLHTPAGSETVFKFFRLFMNEKNRNRIHMHNEDMEALYKFVPKAILPAEYGGDAGPIQKIVDDWKKKVESYRDFYLEEAKYKTDEQKRKGAPKTSDSLFGIEGSFRQLSVD